MKVKILFLGMMLLGITSCFDSDSQKVVELGNQAFDGTKLLRLLSRPNEKPPAVATKTMEYRLQQWVEDEVLYKAALERELNQKPAIQAAVRKILTQALLQQEKEKVLAALPDEQGLKAYFEEHRNLFEKPAKKRFADIFLPTKPNNQKAVIKTAQKILRQAQSKKFHGRFGVLIEQHSATPSNYPKGDTGYLTLAKAQALFGEKHAAKLFQMKKPHTIYPQLIKTKDGVHIIMLTSYRPEQKQSWRLLRGTIRNHLYNQRWQTQKQKLLEKLKQDFGYQLNQKAWRAWLKKYSRKKEPTLFPIKGGKQNFLPSRK